MKKIISIIIILAAGSVVYFKGCRQEKTATIEQEIVSVTRGDIRETILATGVVEPQNRVELNSPVAGRVEEILVHEGDKIKKGQTLAWISSTERATLLDAARNKGEKEFKRWSELYKPTPLVAPLDGEIIARKMEPGQSVTSEKAILVMSDVLIVNVQVDETDISKVRLDQAAEVQLDAYRDTILPAEVSHIAYEAETVNNVTIYSVEVLPERIPEFLRSGMTANITFIVASTNNALLVPTQAIEQRDGKMWVQRLNASPTEITVGLSDGKQTEVRSGLREGDQVLIAQLQLSSEGNEQKGNPLIPFSRTQRRSSGNRR